MADANKINQIETKNILKVNSIEDKNLARIGNTPVSFAQIPAGLIVFLNDTSIPSGWERFTAPDDKMIVGAGSTYSIGDNGVGGLQESVETSLAGTHQGTSTPQWRRKDVVVPDTPYWNQNSGAHSHLITNFDYSPTKKGALLIKALDDQEKFPVNSLLVSKQSQQGLTNITSYNDNFIRPYTNLDLSVGTGSFDLATAGSHNHGPESYLLNNLSTRSWYDNLDGAHNDTGLILSDSDLTLNVKRVLLSLWTDSISQIEVSPNMIAMWESLTPPDGWNLCNGQNGTPDLRDNFIIPVTTGSEIITPQGNNTFTFNSYAIDHLVSHDHSNTGTNNHSQYITNQYHASYSWSHQHILNSEVSWIPPYYALSFIMKAA